MLSERSESQMGNCGRFRSCAVPRVVTRKGDRRWGRKGAGEAESGRFFNGCKSFSFVIRKGHGDGWQ